MILDSSAVIGVLLGEKRSERLQEAMEGADLLVIGAPTLFETGMVLVGRVGDRGREAAARFLEEWEVEIMPFDQRHWRVAIDAFGRYGKGRHPAGLNFGDCMTYAAARLAEMPLLCTGDDFPQTDLRVA